MPSASEMALSSMRAAESVSCSASSWSQGSSAVAFPVLVSRMMVMSVVDVIARSATCRRSGLARR